MSSTNKTTNYELPIFIGTDKPAWLVDWNSAMNAIDTAIKAAETKADNAGTDIGSIQSDITTINGALTTLNNAVSQLRLDTNANTGSINTIQELIGNGTPTTTDKTLIGAINELNAKSYNFDLSTHTGSGTITGTGTGGTIRYAINSDKTIGKIYGGIRVDGFNTAVGDNVLANISIPDLPAASSQYSIDIGYVTVYDSSWAFNAFLAAKFVVKTDKTIDLVVTDVSSRNNAHFAISLAPCVLFLENFGD